MTSSLDLIRGRSNVVTLTNNSGGALVAGDVCIQDTSADEKATTTTSANSLLKVFVAADSIGIGAAGRFYSAGYCPLVTPSASVTRGRYLFTHTVAKQCAENATYGAGAFGVILKSGTTPSAWLFGATAQGSGGGVARSGSTTDGHLAVWNGSSADSIKDGGVVGTSGMTKIATVGAGASFDFTSIPATYTDLKIIVLARGDTSALNVAVHMHFNNDTAGNYDSETIDAANTSLTAGPDIGSASNFIGVVAAASATASQAGSIEITIPAYASTAFFKRYICAGGMSSDQTAAHQASRYTEGQWRNAAAIDRVTIVPNAGAFAAGSTATLYGLG